MRALLPLPPSPTRRAAKPDRPMRKAAKPQRCDYFCGRPSTRARALVREQLKDGPRAGAEIEAAADAAAIPARSLIAAASALGVRTRRGEWWLPG